MNSMKNILPVIFDKFENGKSKFGLCFCTILGISSISSQNGREESNSSIMDKNRGYCHSWKKHANAD